MKNTMKTKKILFFMALLAIPGISLVQAQSRDAETNFFQQSFGDLSDELRVAVEEGKKGVFVMFDDKDCPWCAKMKATVLNQPQVQDYYRKHFRIMRIDANGDTLITDFEGNELSEKVFAEKKPCTGNTSNDICGHAGQAYVPLYRCRKKC